MKFHSKGSKIKKENWDKAEECSSKPHNNSRCLCSIFEEGLSLKFYRFLIQYSIWYLQFQNKFNDHDAKLLLKFEIF